jgi:hypothetical protein
MEAFFILRAYNLLRRCFIHNPAYARCGAALE